MRQSEKFGKETGWLLFVRMGDPEWLRLLDMVYKMGDYPNYISRSQYNLKIEIKQSFKNADFLFWVYQREPRIKQFLSQQIWRNSDGLEL